MIYIRVDGEWYSTKYTRYTQLAMYECGHAEVVYDLELNTIISKELWNPTDGFNVGLTDEQIRLEIFLQGEKFHEWSMYLHRYGPALTSDRMNKNASFDD